MIKNFISLYVFFSFFSAAIARYYVVTVVVLLKKQVTFAETNTNLCFHLTLFETGGGKFAPDATNLSAISVPNVLRSPKFMTLFHSMSDLS